MNSQITDFALAEKWPARGASGFATAEADAANSFSSANSPASASNAAPLPARFRNSRRERYVAGGAAKIQLISVIDRSLGCGKGHLNTELR